MPAKITTITAFIARAKKLGARIEGPQPVWDGKDRSKLFAWASSPNGGCGSPGCSCSPGLWVAATEGTQHVLAHFGVDFERGGWGVFDDHDIDAFRKLRAESGAN